jgi:hypothetical protein
MFAPHRRPRKRVPSVVLLLALPVCGCGDGIPRAPVEGTVLFDGAPLRGMTGAVTFVPNTSRGNDSTLRATGTIDGDGHYILLTNGKPGAPPGHYKVLITAVRPGANRDESKLAIPARYGGERTTTLEREVVTEPSPGRYDLKLTRR